MKKLNNEHGYVLLIVLFLIVLIMSISAVFLRGSIGNAQQERRADESHLTVMAAEAGIDYTKIVLNNEFSSREEEMDNLVKQFIASTPKGQAVNYEEIHEQMMTKLSFYLEDAIQRHIGTGNAIKIIEPYEFRLVRYSFSSRSDREIVFEGEIEGIQEENRKVSSKKISFQQSFNIPDYSQSSEATGDGTSVVPPNMRDLYPDSTAAPDCKGKKVESTTCKGIKNNDYQLIQQSTVYFPNGLSIDNGNLRVYDSTIYSKTDLKVSNLNKIINSDLNIDGTFQAKNMNGIENSTLRIHGTASITSNTDMEKSNMLILGSAHLNGHLNVSKNSMVCITGSLTVDKQLIVEKGSKLVHWGSFVAFGGIRGDGEIIQANSEADVWDRCNLPNEQSIKWINPTIIDVKYD